MIKKKLVKRSKEHDFAALDAAVSELSQKTTELLGATNKEQTTKPILPKKNSRPALRGRSFDIISAGARSQPATLKTAVSTLTVTAGETHPLLSEHAGYSFNELGSEESEVRPVKSSQTTTPTVGSVISGHAGTLMHAQSDSQNEVPASTLTSQPRNLKVNNPEPSKREVTGSDDYLKKVQKDTSELSVIEENVSPVDTQKQLEDTHEVSPSGLYASTFPAAKESRRYEPPQNQQKPTVFDTNEYHESLHDWSKLARRSPLKIIFVLVLLCALGVSAYLFISGRFS